MLRRRKQPRRRRQWPKAGARGNEEESTARDRWGAPLPLFAREPIRSRRGGKQLWTAAFALQVEPIAEHLVLGGLAEATAAKYNAGFRDFGEFTERMCADHPRSWSAFLDGTDQRKDEDHLLHFVAYQGWLLGLAPGTVQGKLNAIRWQHVIEGLPNPLEGKTRLKSAMKKLKKLRGDSHSKLPVTADMLRHIRGTLDFSVAEDVTLWAALMFGWFFCLRQSEYLADGLVFDGKRALTGWKVMPQAGGQPTAAGKWETADALSVLLEVSKTDQARRGCTRTVHASGEAGGLCVVEAYKMLRRLHGAGHKPEGPLLQTPGGWIASRTAVSDTIKKAAKELNCEPGDYATHSLRIGGATALFCSGVSHEEVRRFGRWASDCWRRYVYESRESTREFARKMAGSTYTMQMSMRDYLAASSSRFSPESSPSAAAQEATT